MSLQSQKTPLNSKRISGFLQNLDLGSIITSVNTPLAPGKKFVECDGSDFAVSSIQFPFNNLPKTGIGIGPFSKVTLADTTINFKDIAYSPDLSLWVAVSDNGSIYSSPNGTTWTSRTSNVTVAINKIIWANGLFVAVGEINPSNGRAIILTSPNGLSWALRGTSNAPMNILYSITWNATLGLYIACGANGTITTAPSGGTVWTTRTTPTGNTLTSIATISSDNKLVAVGAANQIISSTDGINWTLRTPPTEAPTATTWVNVLYVPNTGFIATSRSTTLFLIQAVSTDGGVTWTKLSPNGQSFPYTKGTILNALAYGSDLICYVVYQDASATNDAGLWVANNASPTILNPRGNKLALMWGIDISPTSVIMAGSGGVFWVAPVVPQPAAGSKIVAVPFIPAIPTNNSLAKSFMRVL